MYSEWIFEDLIVDNTRCMWRVGKNRKSLNVSLSSRVGVGAGWWPEPSGYEQPLTLPQQRTRPSFRGTFVNGGPLELVAGGGGRGGGDSSFW